MHLPLLIASRCKGGGLGLNIWNLAAILIPWQYGSDSGFLYTITFLYN
jgi:hypothetical protein